LPNAKASPLIDMSPIPSRIVALTPARAATVTTLDQTFDVSRVGQPVTVWRGFADGRTLLPADWQTRDLAGLSWTDPAYTSTTADPGCAEAYAGTAADRGFIARIRLSAGTPAVAVYDEPGGMDDEGEIVLPRGYTYRVTRDCGAQGAYAVRLLDLEALPPERPPPEPAVGLTGRQRELAGEFDRLLALDEAGQWGRAEDQQMRQVRSALSAQGLDALVDAHQDAYRTGLTLGGFAETWIHDPVGPRRSGGV